MMRSVILVDEEWGQVMAIIALAPWKDANPLLMKIGEQLRAQTVPPAPPKDVQQNQSDGNGQETRP